MTTRSSSRAEFGLPSNADRARHADHVLAVGWVTCSNDVEVGVELSHGVVAAPGRNSVLHRDCCTVEIDLVHSRVRGRVSGTGAPLITVTPVDYDGSRTRRARSPQRPANQPCSTRSHQLTVARPLTRRPVLDNRRSRHASNDAPSWPSDHRDRTPSMLSGLRSAAETASDH